MGGKNSGRDVGYPGQKLAKGWIENDDQERAKRAADRRLFALLNDLSVGGSRRLLYQTMIELTRKWLCLARLEEVRAMISQLEEDLGQ